MALYASQSSPVPRFEPYTRTRRFWEIGRVRASVACLDEFYKLLLGFEAIYANFCCSYPRDLKETSPTCTEAPAG